MKITPKYLEWKVYIDIPIGSKFVRDGLKYKCIESSNHCYGCVFRNTNCIGVLCIGDYRKDNKNVIFIKTK